MRISEYDSSAVPAKVQVERIFRELLRAGAGFTPITFDESGGENAQKIAHRGLLQARALAEEARESFAEQIYGEVIEDLSRAIGIYESISGFLDGLEGYLDALAMLGVARILNEEKALGLR